MANFSRLHSSFHQAPDATQAWTADQGMILAAIATDAQPVNPGAAPYTGIVQIFATFGNEYWEGSGVLLSPTEVLTAAHVVWHTAEGQGTDIMVVSGNEQPYGGTYGGVHASASSVAYNPVYDLNDKESFLTSQSDYAIIKLATPIYNADYFGLLTNYAGGTATISGYPATADDQQMAQTGQFSQNTGYSLLQGPSLGPGSSGGPLWITGTDGQNYVVGLASTEDTATGVGNDVQITDAANTQIEGWRASFGSHPVLLAEDTSLGEQFTPALQDYSGPVAGLGGEYINISPDNLNITSRVSGVFLHSGYGEDAIQVASGTNVLDGGTGSNFLVGGTGSDTFFTDDRGATASIWDTLVNFHVGDAATIFGVTQAGFDLVWTDNEGAAGYTGLTLHATSAGAAEASVTLAGFTTADLSNGRLTLSYGVTNGSPYLYISGTG